ncbi:MAG: inositol phosphate phosphatase SopB [Bordetella sp.]|uniref:inositol phosphate phosphatase SopB n=1 Tax=Bordetella sp. TaxID=28081 RepID=UPI003F7BF462
MATGIEGFRQIGTGMLDMDREVKRDVNHGGVRQSSSSRLSARIQGFFKSPAAPMQQLQHVSRAGVKREFYDLLVKTEGREGAQRAMRAVVGNGLGNWLTNDRPLTTRTVSLVLDKAQEYRMGCVKHNEKQLDDVIKNSRLNEPGLRDARAEVARAIKSDPRYGSEKLSQGNIDDLVDQALEKYESTRAGECEKRFPGLSGLVKQPGSGFDKVDLEPKSLLGGIAVTFGAKEPVVTKGLAAMQETTALLGQSAWNQTDLKNLGQQLTDKRAEVDGLINQAIERDIVLGDRIIALDTQIATLEQQLDTLPRNDPGRDGLINQIDAAKEEKASLIPTRNLLLAMEEDLHHQLGLIDSKIAYVDELRLNDPLSDRSVKHSNLVWANAGNVLLDRLDKAIEDGDVQLDGAQRLALQKARLDWQDKIGEVGRTYQDSENGDLQSISGNKKETNHPIVQGKQDIQNQLRSLLEGVGVPRDALQDLLSDKSWKQAEPKALSTMETWQPVSRDMVVMRDGVMRTYKSEITPGHLIDPRLGVVDPNGRVGGTSAGVTDSLDHARNLKVSKLIGTDGQPMTTMIGHGVLDMWGVQDPQARRQSNETGAKEVLELALSSNDRLRTTLETRDPLNPGPNPRLVHVSVNLISPDSLRDNLGVNAYQERTYTFNQFEAFESNSGTDKTLRLLGGDHQNRTATVDVDTITFSFGINAIATGTREKFMRTWSNVHEHNTQNMIKLVGDLGEGRFGARGARPGGFVGDVYDRLERVANDANDPNHAVAQEMMGQLRAQTDLVRGMFTEEAFRTGNGDTAKMGREILVLQGMAEQGLQRVGAADLAGTMSKGCKSDKDRGGVTDVEVKSKLILRDMGGEMNPDETLQGDDQGVYYTVSSSSGQLENQRWNTGLPGSKEAGHLKDRLPDPQVRQYLCGLGAFAKA